jgi:hypothetical protein
MSLRRRPPAVALPFLLAELTFASWETMMHRSWMMAAGTCSPAEYQRMVLEKMQAAQRSAMVLMQPWTAAGAAAMLAPWHRRARANARRLRRRQS